MRSLRLITLLALLGLGSGAAAAAQDDPKDRHQSRRLSLVANGSRLADVAESLAQAAGCRIQVDETLRDLPVTLRLSPRSVERLARAVAREAAVRLSVSYRLEPVSSGQPVRPPWIFAHDLVLCEPAMPQPVRAAAAALGVPVEVAEGVRGTVALPRNPRPLGEVLDSLARQTRSRWLVVLKFESRAPASDPDAAEADRMHLHLNELGQLSPEDRRAELAEELQRLERLPEQERAAGTREMARDLRSLGTLLQRVPGEHRQAVGSQILPLVQDYRQVLTALPSGKQQLFQPLLGALQQLDASLRMLR